MARHELSRQKVQDASPPGNAHGAPLRKARLYTQTVYKFLLHLVGHVAARSRSGGLARVRHNVGKVGRRAPMGARVRTSPSQTSNTLLNILDQGRLSGLRRTRKV